LQQYWQNLPALANLLATGTNGPAVTTGSGPTDAGAIPNYNAGNPLPAAPGMNGQGQNPLGGLFQQMFGRRRRGGDNGMRGGGGGGGGMASDPNKPPGITDRVWDASGHNLQQAQARMAFEAANGGYTGWGPVGSAAGNFTVDNNLQWNEPILDHGTMAPRGAPRFATPDGMVYANGYNPMTGFVEDPNLWDPSGNTRGRFQPTVQQLNQQPNWASVPWQQSWADPNASNFYMTAQNLGTTPASYFNTTAPGPSQPGYAPGGYGPLADAQYNQGGGGWGGGWTGGPQGPGPQGPPPGGAQGGPPPMTPPGGNGPTGPSNLPSGFQMGPNGQVGNFNMYAGMPYAGGMGPYSGWLPPAVGTQVDFGAPGTAPSPMDAATAAPGTYAPGPTVQPGQYANLGMPQGGGQSGGTWGTNGAQGWGYW
jgi:hypothetical protein